ncbi:DJ-1/PfpI family protein [Bacillus cereus]|nr:DJ-1/PfpI family protein [Bacillus cereus]
MKKALVLIYDGFNEFEINLPCYILKNMGLDVVTLSINHKEPIVHGSIGFILQPQIFIKELIDVDKYEVFIIPGGENNSLYKCNELFSLIQKFQEMNKIIATISNGKKLLIEAGIHGSDILPCANEVEVNNNIIIAKELSVVKFSEQILQELGLYEKGKVEKLKNLSYI